MVKRTYASSTTVQIQGGPYPNGQSLEPLQDQIESMVNYSLSRFSDYLTYVGLYLTDESQTGNGRKAIRCTIEIQLKGRHSAAATFEADTLAQAIVGATNRVKKTLRRTMARVPEPGDRTSNTGQ